MIKQKTLIIICGITLIVCALLTFSLLSVPVFPQQRMLCWVVTLGMITDWARYPMSIDKIVGLFLNYSLFISFYLIAFGASCILIATGLIKINCKKFLIWLLMIALLCLCVFYLSAFVVNVILITDPLLNPTFAFFSYMAYELITTISLLFICYVIFKQLKNDFNTAAQPLQHS